MKYKGYQDKLEAMQKRVARLQEEMSRGQYPSKDIFPAILEDLSTSLEELQVSEEELQFRNEQLVDAQQTIEEERRRYQDLFNFAPDPYLVTDEHGTIREANIAAGEMLATKMEFLERKPLIAFFNEKDRKMFRNRLIDLDETDLIRNWETWIYPRKGRPIFVSITIGVSRGPFARVVEVRWMIRDITERMESRRALKEKDELERSNTDLERFAYVASHDMKEPIRMIASFLGLLERDYADKLDDQAREYIDFAVDGAKRMQSLINDLLTYSRVRSAVNPPAPTDCEKIFERVISVLYFQIEETGAQITHDPLPTVPADETQLAQVFQNLIDNGIKFRKPDEPPRIHVSAEQQKGRWLFTVKDDGTGIDPKDHERVFELFQRLHSRKDYSGTGIGLAIVKRIIERHGGDIWLDSKLGEGSTFYFTLPMKSQDDPPDEPT